MQLFVARANDMVVEELDDGLVIYDAQSAEAHWLDPSATAVWRACAEPRTEAEVTGATDLDDASCQGALARLIELGLVETYGPSGHSRRVVLRTAARAGLGGMVAAPIISAIVPVAAAHASTPVPPGAAPLTPGYWKNHATQTTALLPQVLGNYIVSSFSQAAAVFANMNFGGQNSPNGLAGHLLAAKLNFANGASKPACAQTAMAQADALLVSIGYVGPTGSYNLSASQRQSAVALATTLNNYNNGSLTC